MNDVERRHDISARHAAKERDELEFRNVHMWQHADASEESAAVSDADHGMALAFDGQPEISAARQGQRAHREWIIINLGSHNAFVKLVPAPQFVLELNAACDRCVDADADEAKTIGARNKPVRFDARDIEALGDLVLR